MSEEKTKTPGMPADPKAAAKLLMQLRGQKKFAGLLGIARKAGKVTAGTNLVTDAIRAGSPRTCPFAVFLASDASENTRKRVTNCCSYYEIPLHETTMTTDMMGSAIGKSGAISCVGITDKGLADALTNLL
ncbi:MAG: ribosomal L7Ae/L30e/S12e/Gadd45 family protein [Clostridia bacterium]|nr:ribosomal L7Ae/L30e/S12e/Gadd45 family protein [Clostridia bacterium]